MKSIKTISALVVMAAALCCAPALAFEGALTAHAIGATEASVILPADNNSRTMVAALNVVSDKAGSKVSVYWSDGVFTSVDQASTSTTLYVAATTGFAQNNLIAIQTAGGAVIYRTVSGVSAGESLTISSALPATHGNVGDAVYLLAAAGANTDAEIPVGAADKELTNRLGVIIGPKDSPLLFILDGTSACAINYLTWGFK
jgi:hypothetical protein